MKYSSKFHNYEEALSRDDRERELVIRNPDLENFHLVPIHLVPKLNLGTQLHSQAQLGNEDNVDM